MKSIRPLTRHNDEREKGAKVFLTEEYKVKWSYLQHTEQTRDRIFSSFVTISGAILAFLVNGKGPIDLSKLEPELQVALMFICIFAIFLCLLLSLQNRNYRAYSQRLVDIELRLSGSSSIVQKPPSRSLIPRISVFRLYLFFPSLIGTLSATAATFSFFHSNAIGLLTGTAILVVTFVVIPGLLDTKMPTKEQEVSI